MLGSRDRATAGGKLDLSSNVVAVQPSYLARPTTKAPETQIYFITHGSGANSVPRVRTVVRGERASRSIVNSLTALWSIGVVSSLILAGLGLEPPFVKTWGPEDDELPQLELNHFGGRVRTAENAPCGPLGGVPPGRAAFKGSSKEIRASGLLRH